MKAENVIRAGLYCSPGRAEVTGRVRPIVLTDVCMNAHTLICLAKCANQTARIRAHVESISEQEERNCASTSPPVRLCPRRAARQTAATFNFTAQNKSSVPPANNEAVGFLHMCFCVAAAALS